jgi:virginiamycin A acetyltransferase
MSIPADPTVVRPMPEQPRVVLLKPLITAPLIDYGIVGGNPARLIRRRHSDEDVDRLLEVAWWDWPLQRITDHVRTILPGSIDDLERAASAIEPS